MERGLKRIGAVLLALLIWGMVPAYAAGEDSQIAYTGDSAGSLEEDGVQVSKTVAETGIENYFDITLTAKTRKVISEEVCDGNMAVVLVMDLSNTMNYAFGSSAVPKNGEKSRYDAAVNAAEEFIHDFARISQDDSSAYRSIGVVAFNTNGHKISDMTKCASKQDAEALIDQMKKATRGIIRAEGYADSKTRFTNMEAGLKRAKDMLDGVTGINGQDKIIVFITDGYPTTYLKDTNGEDYEGYEPYSAGGDPGENGVFYDGNQNGKVHCCCGVDYSDKAAKRAAAMAKSIRDSGIDIYSVGVDLNGQSIEKYEEKNYGKDGKGGLVATSHMSTIDTLGDGYEIKDFTKWLTGIDTNGGIGSGEGYYYPCESTSGLVSALERIFNSINKDRVFGTTALSTVDPIYSQDMGDYIQFVGFFGKVGTESPSLEGGNLSGSNVSWDTEGAENTAALSTKEDKSIIKWDIENSAYSRDVVTEGSVKTITYTYTLKYRVRLKNEADAFAGSADYHTNGTTILTYDNTEIDGSQTIEYPLPKVRGYFGQLSFKKADSNTGAALSGAEFALKHAADCRECEKGGCDVTIEDITAVSDSEGIVSFDKIPSGHSYTLIETKAPDLHHILREAYDVKVSYGKTTVTGEGEHFSDTLSGTVITNDSVLPGDVTVSLQKLLNGNTPPDGEFEFVLTDENGSVKTSKATNGEASFVLNFKGAEIDVNKAYRYTLRESKTNGRYIYDDTVYTVVITFAKNDESYTANVAYYKGENIREETPLNGPPTFYNHTRSNPPHTHLVINVPPKTGDAGGLGMGMALMFAAIVLAANGRRGMGKR